eukprot:SAG11_NODE_8337_length_1027_cov_0.904095_2_plen_189_part_01
MRLPGHFAIESENLKFNTPELTILRTQVLEYFEQLQKILKSDHVLFQFERSTHFPETEKQYITQLCLNTGHPLQDVHRYFTGEDGDLLENYPDLAYFRDIVFIFKALLAPTSDALPEISPWAVKDAVLSWSTVADKASPTGYSYAVDGFGRTLACIGYTAGSSDQNFFTRLFSNVQPRSPPSGANPSVV